MENYKDSFNLIQLFATIKISSINVILASENEKGKFKNLEKL